MRNEIYYLSLLQDMIILLLSYSVFIYIHFIIFVHCIFFLTIISIDIQVVIKLSRIYHISSLNMYSLRGIQDFSEVVLCNNHQQSKSLK